MGSEHQKPQQALPQPIPSVSPTAESHASATLDVKVTGASKQSNRRESKVILDLTTINPNPDAYQDNEQVISQESFTESTFVTNKNKSQKDTLGEKSTYYAQALKGWNFRVPNVSEYGIYLYILKERYRFTEQEARQIIETRKESIANEIKIKAPAELPGFSTNFVFISSEVDTFYQDLARKYAALRVKPQEQQQISSAEQQRINNQKEYWLQVAKQIAPERPLAAYLYEKVLTDQQVNVVNQGADQIFRSIFGNITLSVDNPQQESQRQWWNLFRDYVLIQAVARGDIQIPAPMPVSTPTPQPSTSPAPSEVPPQSTQSLSAEEYDKLISPEPAYEPDFEGSMPVSTPFPPSGEPGLGSQPTEALPRTGNESQQVEQSPTPTPKPSRVNHPNKQQLESIAQFQQDLKRNAQTRLQQNRDRLNQSQERYANPDPSNQNWASLRQQIALEEQLQDSRLKALQQIFAFFHEVTGRDTPAAGLLLRTVTSAEERRQLLLDFYQEQFRSYQENFQSEKFRMGWAEYGPQMQPLIEKFYIVDALLEQLYQLEPALAVLPPIDEEDRKKNTPERNRQLQQQMSKGFDTARNSIGKLEKALQDDKEGNLALKFDQVVEQTLAEIKNPQQRQQIVEWLQQRQQTERKNELKGTIGTVSLTIGAIAASTTGVGLLAILFGGSATLLGGSMAIDGFKEAGMLLDTVQAGQLGGERLTAANPQQAQMSYQLAVVSLSLALLDAGVTVNSVRQVLSQREAVQALFKLKPAQKQQFARVTQLQEAGNFAGSEKLLQEFLDQSKDLAKSEREVLARLVGRKSSIFQDEWSAEVKAYFDEYYGKIGRTADDVSDLVESSRRRGVTVEEGDVNEFARNKKTRGTIRYSADGEMPIKRWSYKEEFLHSLVEQARKRKKQVQPQIDRMITANKKASALGQPLPYSEAEIEQLTPKSLREISRIKKEIEARYPNKKDQPPGFSPGDAAEEIFVKEWLLKHSKLGEVGEAERVLLETQIERLRKYGFSRGY
jgi:hypothetical protein